VDDRENRPDVPVHPDYPLYKTDTEIAELVGVGEKKWRANARVLEKSGLPAGDPLFAGRRYWPAVKAFLDRRNGLGGASALVTDGEENWDEPPRRQRKR
jgi:hypothetical protein